ALWQRSVACNIDGEAHVVPWCLTSELSRARRASALERRVRELAHRSAMLCDGGGKWKASPTQLKRSQDSRQPRPSKVPPKIRIVRVRGESKRDSAETDDERNDG